MRRLLLPQRPGRLIWWLLLMLCQWPLWQGHRCPRQQRRHAHSWLLLLLLLRRRRRRPLPWLRLSGRQPLPLLLADGLLGGRLLRQRRQDCVLPRRPCARMRRLALLPGRLLPLRRPWRQLAAFLGWRKY